VVNSTRRIERNPDLYQGERIAFIGLNACVQGWIEDLGDEVTRDVSTAFGRNAQESPPAAIRWTPYES
jgi:hypothetical protein